MVFSLELSVDHPIFINRRKNQDRRLDDDPCRDLPIDLYHRKRRKKSERRAEGRSLSDDYYAYCLSLENDCQTSDTASQ